MQVLTIVVQSTVAYEDLGVATSGVTFFRTLGSSFGAAVFGTVYANVLNDTLPGGRRRVARGRPGGGDDPAALHAYPAEMIAPIVDAYAHALHVVFLAAVPVAAGGFVLALFLKEVPLRDTARDAATDLGEGFGMPEGTDANQQLQLADRPAPAAQGAPGAPRVRERSRAAFDASDGWAVGQVYLRSRLGRTTDLEEISRALPAAARGAPARIRRSDQARLPRPATAGIGPHRCRGGGVRARSSRSCKPGSPRSSPTGGSTIPSSAAPSASSRPCSSRSHPS